MKKKEKILVTGGAGYIGSACVKDLCRKGYQVEVVDNLSKGRRELVDKKAGFIKLDILDLEKLKNFIKEKNFDAVIHFASHKDAGASMEDAPLYSENIRAMINLLDSMVEHSIAKIIFSSSAAVYGDPQYSPADENHPLKPINYYGYTKMACEQLMQWYKLIHGIEFVSLRYFNVAGDHGLGYLDPYAKNLFPIIQDVLSGKREELQIYGDDYETRDGTGVRDYIHLSDLVEAHLKALELEGSDVFNLGTKEGQSVLEVVREFEKQSGKKIPRKFVPRRKGDPAELIADSSKAAKKLRWSARRGLAEMVESTLRASS
ncbi:MAG: UDP-glucose 4-epimerase GalE [Candidatus Moranbacteria bacterium]|nr:UDP-glucose 4-epimerase GalE [Candidatus Moranbacteria bacterium]